METHSFLQQALVLLAAGVLAVPIFRRFGLGSVLGYLVAGMAIGPWGLKLIADPERVLQFSELGVVLLLFLIGLELNLERVRSLRRAIFGLGSVQVAVTIAAVAVMPKRWPPCALVMMLTAPASERMPVLNCWASTSTDLWLCAAGFGSIIGL